MINIEENLRKYNITIPKANKPVANYSPYVKTDNLIFISGQIPIADGNMLYTGKIKKEIELSSAVKAAELCMLNSFAVLKNAVQNNLKLIRKCVKINVFINSDDLFTNQPKVADGASDLITKILGPSLSIKLYGVSSLKITT